MSQNSPSLRAQSSRLENSDTHYIDFADSSRRHRNKPTISGSISSSSALNLSSSSASNADVTIWNMSSQGRRIFEQVCHHSVKCRFGINHDGRPNDVDQSAHVALAFLFEQRRRRVSKPSLLLLLGYSRVWLQANTLQNVSPASYNLGLTSCAHAYSTSSCASRRVCGTPWIRSKEMLN